MELTEKERDFIYYYRALTRLEQLAVRCYIFTRDPRLLSWLGQGRETLNSFMSTPIPERNNEFTFLGT
jgi:hypothetical protein